MLRLWLSVLTLSPLIACAPSSTEPAKPHTDVEGPSLWVQVAGQGDPTVVFEAGEGDDSTIWEKTEAAIRLPNGVRTVLYDRAGLGKSGPTSGPYRIDDEVTALKQALDRFSIRGPIVLVAHSYGGIVATLVAATDKRVAGVVLLDAYVREMFEGDAGSYLMTKATQSLEAVERSKPASAPVMSPLIRAFPETARRMRSIAFPAQIPTIDIVSEKWGESEEEAAAVRRAHAAFASASPEREGIVAARSGHYVMNDRPDLVADAIARIVRRTRDN
jgi:pimeloyl-ACP methyl ester carboxylesterase